MITTLLLISEGKRDYDTFILGFYLQIFGHPQTLKFINSPLEKIAIDITTNERYEFKLPSLSVEALYAPGHTDGHMVLWEPNSK